MHAVGELFGDEDAPTEVTLGPFLCSRREGLMLELNSIAVAISSGVCPVDSHGKFSGSNGIGDDMHRVALDRRSSPLLKITSLKITAPDHLCRDWQRWQQHENEERSCRRNSCDVQRGANHKPSQITDGQTNQLRLWRNRLLSSGVIGYFITLNVAGSAVIFKAGRVTSPCASAWPSSLAAPKVQWNVSPGLI